MAMNKMPEHEGEKQMGQQQQQQCQQLPLFILPTFTLHGSTVRTKNRLREEEEEEEEISCWNVVDNHDIPQSGSSMITAATQHNNLSSLK